MFKNVHVEKRLCQKRLGDLYGEQRSRIITADGTLGQGPGGLHEDNVVAVEYVRVRNADTVAAPKTIVVVGVEIDGHRLMRMACEAEEPQHERTPHLPGTVTRLFADRVVVYGNVEVDPFCQFDNVREISLIPPWSADMAPGVGVRFEQDFGFGITDFGCHRAKPLADAADHAVVVLVDVRILMCDDEWGDVGVCLGITGQFVQKPVDRLSSIRNREFAGDRDQVIAAQGIELGSVGHRDVVGVDIPDAGERPRPFQFERQLAILGHAEAAAVVGFGPDSAVGGDRQADRHIDAQVSVDVGVGNAAGIRHRLESDNPVIVSFVGSRNGRWPCDGDGPCGLTLADRADDDQVRCSQQWRANGSDAKSARLADSAVNFYRHVP